MNKLTELSRSIENKIALITGITGQDGSYLAELLLNKGYKEFIAMSSSNYLFKK